ncbi:MFS transporter [Amycolatopsis jejuensis]|uniref:MFS transporter n=1 Tax=Amycolatopsis jejuensis TaxID=330084 RepID=UPI00068E979D|nr:MFS transporter [Amycolatopsis jejuensis]
MIAAKPRLPRHFLGWLSGALASQLGDVVLAFALGWAASAHGGVVAGVVVSAVSLPQMVLLLLGGAVGDRLGARQVMIVGDAVMLVVAVAVAVNWMGTPPVLLVVVALIIGTNNAFYLPSEGSMPRLLVGGDQLARALALRQSGSQLVSMIGAPLGGLLTAFAGLRTAAGADALTFAIVLIVLIRIRPRYTRGPPGQRAHLLREAAEGVRLALTTAAVRSPLLLVAGAAGLILPFASILIPLVAREHSWNSSFAGVLVGAQSLGTIVATLVISRRGAGARPGLAALGALVVVGAGQLCVALSTLFGLIIAGAFLAGAGTGVFVSNLSPIMLGAAPVAYVARVQALLGLVQSAALLFATNALGSLAHAAGPETAIVVSAGALGCCAIAGFVSAPVRRLTSAGREVVRLPAR